MFLIRYNTDKGNLIKDKENSFRKGYSTGNSPNGIRSHTKKNILKTLFFNTQNYEKQT